MNKIRVLLADDHAVLRAGLRSLLNAEPDIEVVGEAADGEAAVGEAIRLQPDVVVMDIAMPGVNGMEATRQIAASGVCSRVLFLTMHAESQYLLPALRAGGAGYVLKSAADSELIEAIRAVNRGEAYLRPAATRLLVEDYRDQARSIERDQDGLTDRERDVLRLTASGYSSQEIAERLFLSPKTVDTYRLRVMEKLDLHHRSELVRYALRKGLLSPNQE